MGRPELINQWKELQNEIKDSAIHAEMVGAKDIMTKLRDDFSMIPHVYLIMLEDEGYDMSKAITALHGLRNRINQLMKQVDQYCGA